MRITGQEKMCHLVSQLRLSMLGDFGHTNPNNVFCLQKRISELAPSTTLAFIVKNPSIHHHPKQRDSSVATCNMPHLTSHSPRHPQSPCTQELIAEYNGFVSKVRVSTMSLTLFWCSYFYNCKCLLKFWFCVRNLSTCLLCICCSSIIWFIIFILKSCTNFLSELPPAKSLIVFIRNDQS